MKTKLLTKPVMLAAGSFALLALLSLVPESAGSSVGGTLAIFRMLAALVAILGLAAAVVPALRGFGARGTQSRRMECQEVLSLGGKQKVALLVVDGREYLLAINGDGITLLDSLPAEARGEEEEEFPELLSRLQSS